MAESNETVIALVRDLMFVSRITATARAVGVAVQVVRNPAELGSAVGRLLILDLNLSGAMEAAAEWRKQNRAAGVVGFVSHVDSQTIARARELGIEKVLARSRFVEVLEELMRP
jgi:hypothetical protein